MVEFCGYCKDTHGRHFLGCSYVSKESDTVGRVAKDVRAWEATQNVEIDKWRMEHGLQPRVDGILQADGPVREGDVLVVGEGGYTASKKTTYEWQPGYGPEYSYCIECGGTNGGHYKTCDKYGGRDKVVQNPKDIAGSKKPAYDLLAMPHALNLMAEVMKHGADKYGPFNWRSIPISAPAYYAALGRHWVAMSSGEWLDPESGHPHAAHIMATCAIMLDADAHGTLKK